VLAALRWANNMRDRVAGFRVVQLLPGIGPGSAAKLLDGMADSGDPDKAFRAFKPPAAAVEHWRGFVETISTLHLSAVGIAAMDLFVVPTISFRLLYGLLIMGHGRRQILWLGVTSQPTAEWIANQLTAACGWEQIPRDLIRDRDACYGSLFVRRVHALGIRDHPTSARSPWQNGHAERLIGSIRRECLDHIVVTGEQHLRHVLKCYMEYYNAVRTHLSLGKDAPNRRAVQSWGRIEVRPVLAGLHHQYVRDGI
jgi:transposase InsO family protein